MAGFEDLIRGALIKQGSPSAENRQKIYDSARQALQRMLDSNDTLAPAVREAQIARLESAIADIEGGYLEAEDAGKTKTTQTPNAENNATGAAEGAFSLEPEQAPESPAVTPPPSDPIPRRNPAPSEPSVPAEDRRASPAPVAPVVPPPARTEPTFSASRDRVPPPASAESETEAMAVSATDRSAASGPEVYKGDVLKRKMPYAKLLLWTIVLVGLGVSIWWAVNFGPAFIQRQIDGYVPNPQPTLESGAFVPGEGNKNGWVSVFVPDVNAADVVTNGSGVAELQRDGAKSVMRLASPDAKPTSNLLIRVPRGIMQDLKGQAATLEFMVRAPNADSQEFVIYCQFAKMGNCGRKRFTVTSNPEAFIFDILVNDVFLQEGEEAYLALNTDFGSKGRALDLYSIRVRIGS